MLPPGPLHLIIGVQRVFNLDVSPSAVAFTPAAFLSDPVAIEKAVLALVRYHCAWESYACLGSCCG